MRRFVTLVLGAVLALTVAACGADSESTTGQGFVAGDGSIVLLDPSARRPAPEIAGVTLDGKQLSLQELRGQVIALNVWASWCGPCRAEAPDLEAVHREYQDRGFSMVGLVTRDGDAAAQAFVRNYGLTYPSIIDRYAELQLRFDYDTLPPQSIPSTLLIDAEGRVAARVLGPVSAATLRGLIDPLLAERSAS